MLFYLIVETFPFFNNLCAITKGRPGLLDILHTTITITMCDYEIQLIIITITWYGFLKKKRKKTKKPHGHIVRPVVTQHR